MVEPLLPFASRRRFDGADYVPARDDARARGDYCVVGREKQAMEEASALPMQRSERWPE